MNAQPHQPVLIDGSRLIIEALVQAGAEVYTGYPITPANWLYALASQRFPIFLPAPDEISAIQWAAGFAATGKLPVTGTSFPGFALMLESLNMMYMMELPLVLILAQRMGPSTGSATTGAQGDLMLLRGAISGGYHLPVLCPSNLFDCWELAAESAKIALRLRTPVILLTSKEMIMTRQSIDLSELQPLEPVTPPPVVSENGYLPYRAEPLEAPPFLPVGNPHHQVRLNASTHDATGLIRKATPEALANTRRLTQKIEHHLQSDFLFYEYHAAPGAKKLLVSYGISAEATREAVTKLREQNHPISLLILKTLLPISPEILNVIEKYEHLFIVEENYSGLLSELLFGNSRRNEVHRITKIGAMITPLEIEREVMKW
ncbi:MAG: hypothetical protein D6748_05975 [Calditrichaeota bacterium]|nr:MAG: hypothetical protein D6748_05975 [Calditrichota bacterium]